MVAGKRQRREGVRRKLSLFFDVRGSLRLCAAPIITLQNRQRTEDEPAVLRALAERTRLPTPMEETTP